MGVVVCNKPLFTYIECTAIFSVAQLNMMWDEFIRSMVF